MKARALLLVAATSAATIRPQPLTSEMSIFAERLTPTTDAISFSPSRWPILRHHPWSDQLPLHSIAILQRACRIGMSEPGACYTPLDPSPFNHVDSDSPDAKYTLYRAGGTSIPATWACYSPTFSPADDLPFADNQSVSLFIGEPSNAIMNTADYDAPEACRWTLTDAVRGYIRPIAPRSNDNARGAYDYSFEVCQWKGDCDKSDIECINAYSAVALADLRFADATSLFKLPGEPPKPSFVPFPPRQYPPMGAGRIESVFATASNGPHLPCPEADDGTQIACGQFGEAPEADNVLHITNLEVLKLKSLSFSDFTLVVGISYVRAAHRMP